MSNSFMKILADKKKLRNIVYSIILIFDIVLFIFVCKAYYSRFSSMNVNDNDVVVEDDT